MSGIFAHQQMAALKNRFIKITVISPVPYAPKFLRSSPQRIEYGQTSFYDDIDGIPVYYPRYLRLPGTWFHSFSIFFMYISVRIKSHKLIKSFKPDIIHSFSATPEGYVGTLLSKKYKIPNICTLIGSDIEISPKFKPFSYKLTRKMIEKSKALISVSKSLIQSTLNIGTPSRKIDLIYMGVDTARFNYFESDRIALREELHIPETEIVLLFIGNLLKDKGVNDLIKAFSKLCKQNLKTHLIYIGDGPYKSDLQDKISEYKIGTKVHLIGKKPHSEIHRWLNVSDIFILPSYHEGVPNVLLEAASCSRAIIATNVGGISEIIEDGKSGILINKGSVPELISALNHLISNPATIKSIGQEARTIVEKNFSWFENAERTIDIYRDIIRHHNQASL